MYCKVKSVLLCFVETKELLAITKMCITIVNILIFLSVLPLLLSLLLFLNPHDVYVKLDTNLLQFFGQHSMS